MPGGTSVFVALHQLQSDEAPGNTVQFSYFNLLKLLCLNLEIHDERSNLGFLKGLEFDQTAISAAQETFPGVNNQHFKGVSKGDDREGYRDVKSNVLN